MSSRRDQVVVAAMALLNGSGKPLGLTVHRQRTLSLDYDNLPATVVYLLHEEVETGPGTAIFQRKAKRTARLCLEHRVNAEDRTTDTALDPLLSWATQALCADPLLGGLAHELTEVGTTWDESEQDKKYGSAKQFFDVQFFTDASDPDALT